MDISFPQYKVGLPCAKFLQWVDLFQYSFLSLVTMSTPVIILYSLNCYHILLILEQVFLLSFLLQYNFVFSCPLRVPYDLQDQLKFHVELGVCCIFI